MHRLFQTPVSGLLFGFLFGCIVWRILWVAHFQVARELADPSTLCNAQLTCELIARLYCWQEACPFRAVLSLQCLVQSVTPSVTPVQLYTEPQKNKIHLSLESSNYSGSAKDLLLVWEWSPAWQTAQWETNWYEHLETIIWLGELAAC